MRTRRCGAALESVKRSFYLHLPERTLFGHSAMIRRGGQIPSGDPGNLPIIVAGGGYDHGRYVAHDEFNNTPLCNLFANLLNNIGVETESFGTSTGVLEI